MFTYSFGGGLRRPAEDLLAEYYDAMLYLANWGSRRLMFRYPKALVDPEQIGQYNVATTDYPSDAVRAYTQDEHTILDIQLDEEEGLDWIEGEGWLDSLPIDINPIRGIIPIVKSIGLASLTAPIHVIGAAFS